MLEPVLALLVHLTCASGNNLSTTWECKYARALDRMAKAEDEVHRFYELPPAAKSAFELGKVQEARRYAQEMLEAAPRFRDDWNYGNAIHDGHMVLGRVALQNGDAATAAAELLQAGRTRGSPQLNSFGPNVSLARDFLKHKQVDVVVQYFGLCARFWKLERGRLEEWTTLARAGKIPDFGANLDY